MTRELGAALFFVIPAIALLACGETFSAGTAGAGGEDAGTGGATATLHAAGTGGAGGMSSTEGTGGDCVDGDGDGVTTCDGDCDDTLAYVHPGAIEICGDGVDGNCDGAGDDQPPCNGIGTFVSKKKGSETGLGTMDDPVLYVAQGIQNASDIGGAQIVFVAEGVYVEDVLVSGQISLIGGFSADDWSKRDPDVYETIIENTEPEGLKIIAGQGPPTVTGLHVVGLPVLVGLDPSIAVTVDGGESIVTGNEITAGDVTVGNGATVGVRVVTASATGGHVTIFGNMIDTGQSIAGPAMGVLVDSPTMEVVLAENQVNAHKGTHSVGLLVEAAASVTANSNALQSGTATGSPGAPSASFGAWLKSGEVSFDRNLVNADQVMDPPKCFTPDAWCGGVRVSTGIVTLTNNLVAGTAVGSSAAVWLDEQADSLEEVVVSSNLLIAAGDDGLGSRSTSVLLASPAQDAATTKLGRFRNNIFFGGVSDQNYAFFERQLPGDTVDPAALDHNLFFFPDNAPNAGTLYLDWNGVAVNAITQIDKLPGDGANLYADPLLDAFHLAEKSPCRNAGTSEDAPLGDFDGDARPQEDAFDIGPDELVPLR